MNAILYSNVELFVHLEFKKKHDGCIKSFTIFSISAFDAVFCHLCLVLQGKFVYFAIRQNRRISLKYCTGQSYEEKNYPKRLTNISI